ncbi:type VII secretion system-associated protein [Streptomyces antibioticus]|uniref:type VII secretion system-associated protein n=1 Tax=Streptomyces antibioticus TaxID=1890 RepID=UPI00368D0F52
MADVTVLDSEFLKQFITHQIQGFMETLDKILKEDPNAGPAISFIAESGITTTTIDVKKPLHLGLMATDQYPVGGGELNKVVQEAAAEIDRVIDDQTVLFEDIEKALWDTIDELNKNQGRSLESIAGEEFTDIFEDVDSDFAGSGAEDS